MVITPLVSYRSFKPIGIPWRGRRTPFYTISDVAFSASSSAFSEVMVMNEFSLGSVFFILAKCDSTNVEGEISLVFNN